MNVPGLGRAGKRRVEKDSLDKASLGKGRLGKGRLGRGKPGKGLKGLEWPHLLRGKDDGAATGMRLSLCNEVIRDMEFAAQCAFAAAVGYEALEVAPFTLSEPYGIN